MGLPAGVGSSRTSWAGQTAVPYTAYQEAAVLAGMARHADFGPALVEVSPGGSNSALRVIPNDLTVGEVYLTLQNFGSCSLQVVQHSRSGSMQLVTIGPFSSGFLALRLAPQDAVQLLAMTHGTEARCA